MLATAPDLLVLPRTALDDAVADLVAGQLRMGLRDAGRATVALPGAAEAASVVRRLACRPLEWSHVFAVLTDRPWLPRDHPEGHERRLDTWLGLGPARAARRLSPVAVDRTPAEVAATWRPPALAEPLDAVVAHVRADGTLAGLRPGTAQFAAARMAPSRQLVSPVHDVHDVPGTGLASTPATLTRTRRLVLYAPTPAAADRVRRAVDGPRRSDDPLSWCLSHGETPITLALVDAARRGRPGPSR